MKVPYRAATEAAYLYAICNDRNGKRYYGSTVEPCRRWGMHVKALNAGTHHCRYLQASWRKYGPDSFALKLLALVPLLQRNFYENLVLGVADYNRARLAGAPPAGSFVGRKHKPETIVKMRAAAKRRHARGSAREPDIVKAIAEVRAGAGRMATARKYNLGTDLWRHLRANGIGIRHYAPITETRLRSE